MTNSSEDEMYDVERIVGDRVVKGKKQYFIKWLGYPDAENTWEDEHNIFCEDLKREYEENKKAAEDARANKKKIANTIKKKFKNTTSNRFKRIVITNEWDSSIREVIGVSRDEKGIMEVEYETIDGKKGCCKAEEMHQKAPLRLLEFYEANLQFHE